VIRIEACRPCLRRQTWRAPVRHTNGISLTVQRYEILAKDL
jgi:hypothetical protein